MKLSSVISESELIFLPFDAADIDAIGVCTDSRKLRPGELFFSLDGSRANMYDAARKGAIAVVTDSAPDERFPVPTAIVKMRERRSRSPALPYAEIRKRSSVSAP